MKYEECIDIISRSWKSHGSPRHADSSLSIEELRYNMQCPRKGYLNEAEATLANYERLAVRKSKAQTLPLFLARNSKSSWAAAARAALLVPYIPYFPTTHHGSIFRIPTDGVVRRKDEVLIADADRNLLADHRLSQPVHSVSKIFPDPGVKIRMAIPRIRPF